MVSAEARSAPTQPENLRDGLLKGWSGMAVKLEEKGLAGRRAFVCPAAARGSGPVRAPVSRAGVVSVLAPSGLAGGA